MSTLERPNEPLAVGLEVTEDELIVSLADGRKLSVPIAWYPRLANASPKQRRNWEIIGPGVGFHWPDVDEDLSVEGMLRGVPAPGVRPQVLQGRSSPAAVSSGMQVGSSIVVDGKAAAESLSVPEGAACT